MTVRKLAFSVFSAAALWLLLGAPSLKLAGNILIYVVTLIHLYAVLWNYELFRLFRGDAFTYAGAARGISIHSFLSTFVTSWGVLQYNHRHIENVLSISPYAWAFMLFGLFISVSLPVLTGGQPSRLPNGSERRQFEKPEVRR